MHTRPVAGIVTSLHIGFQQALQGHSVWWGFSSPQKASLGTMMIDFRVVELHTGPINTNQQVPSL